MEKKPDPRWVKLHTIAMIEKGPSYSLDGLIAVVDGKEAGIVGFYCESYFGFEEGIKLTDCPLPHEVFDLDPWTDWTEYFGRKEYIEHPDVAGFTPQIDWIWEGTAEELLTAAQNNTDLMFAGRPLSEEDSDYKEMMELYAEIRKYLSKGKRKKRHRSGHQKPDNRSMQDGW